MTALAAAAAWLVALVLAWAGIAKLAAGARTAAGFRSLGIPAAGAVAIAVPVAELAAALLLVTVPPIGATVSLGLLAVFTAFLVLALRRGLGVPCGCFGSARPEPITYAALVRNALLASAAGVAALAPSPARPVLEAVIAVGAAAALGFVLVGLAELRATTGRLWDNRVEPGPEGRAA